MSTFRRPLTLAALVAIATAAHFLADSAVAEGPRNTYADFPFNQGSLFYRPLGANAYTRPRSAPRRAYAPRYYYPQRGGYYYPQPQPQPYYSYPQGYYRPY